MLNIELDDYGVENVLEDIRDCLEDALDNNISKKQKNEAICKALGAVKALCYMIKISEVDTDAEVKPDI